LKGKRVDKSRPKHRQATATKTLVTTAMLAAVFGVHPQTIYKLVREGRIPAVRLRSALRFDIDEVKKALTEGSDSESEDDGSR